MFREDRDRIALRGVLTLATLVAATACDAPSLPEVSAASRVEAQCPPLSHESYFATGSLTTNRTNDASLRANYGELLGKASAPPLWCGQGPGEAYRLLWLASFGSALIVTANRTDGDWTVHAVEFTTKDPNPWGGWIVERRAQRHLPAAVMAPMFRALERGAFWSAAFYQPGGDDGERWTIEGRRNTGYRAVTRWSDSDQHLSEAARTLVRLSGLELPEQMRERRQP
jgi:hypothetical protein